MRKYVLFLILICLSTSFYANVFTAMDSPNDGGTALDLAWETCPLTEYVTIYRLTDNSEWVEIAKIAESSGKYRDIELEINKEYHYRLQIDDDLSLEASAVTKEQWFNADKLGFLVFLLIVCLAIIYYITAAKRGKTFYIRRIAGLDSMEEAIGRATEKGKPILYVPGISDLDNIGTIASLTILSNVAEKSAEYGTELIVPCRSSMVLSAAKEVVQEAYIKAGRPDAYNKDNIFYLTDEQFGFVAGVDGIMLREQPAANFFLGAFYAESLILAETGFSTGAIQTAGTAQAAQLPFFVVSCDYTLIGEELFAASAYLSEDPQQLGSLKGHDFGKLIFIILITAGVILEILGYGFLKEFIVGAAL